MLDDLADRAADEERQGRWDASALAYSRLFRTSLARGELVRAVNALRGQARVRREQGRFEEAGELAELSRVIAELHGMTLESARALNVLGIIRYAEGRWAEAESLYESALGQAIDVGDDELVGLVCQNLGALASMRGRLREARIHYLEGIASSIRSRNRRNQATIYNNLGLVCCDLREWMEAELYFGRGIEIAELIDDGVHIALLLANRATPLIHMGELGRARETLTRADAAARCTDSQLAMADVARLRGVLARMEGDKAASYAYLSESVRIAIQAGLDYEQGEALTELGILHLQEGEHGLAIAALKQARDILDTLGASGHADRVVGLLRHSSQQHRTDIA